MSGSRWVITPLWLCGSLDLFCIVLLCIFATSYYYLPWHFSPSLCPSLYEIFPWYLFFLKRSLVFPILMFSSFFFFPCISHLGSLSYLSLLLFGTLNSDGYIFPFLIYLWLLFFSQLFVRPLQITSLPFCLSSSWGWLWSLPPVQCYEPLSIVLQALYLSDLVPWI